MIVTMSVFAALSRGLMHWSCRFWPFFGFPQSTRALYRLKVSGIHAELVDFCVFIDEFWATTVGFYPECDDFYPEIGEFYPEVYEFYPKTDEFYPELVEFYPEPDEFYPELDEYYPELDEF